jgi:glycine betaine/proline transport system substrate-binding protein
MLSYVNTFKQGANSESNSTVAAVKHTLETKSTGVNNAVHSYWVFGVFTFLFFGFGYALLYETINKMQADESSPIVSSRNMNNAHVNIALLDWPAAQIKAHILNDVINTHTETRAHLVSIAHQRAFEEIGKKKGAIDVHPDIWVANNAPLIRKFVRAFKSMELSQASSYGQQGLCYTSYKNSTPLSITKLTSADIAAEFDLSNDSKGDIWVGAKGWTAVDIEKRRLNAYGLSAHYDYHVFDQDLLHQLLKRNNENQQSSLFFCYYPDALFSNANVKFVGEPPHNEAHWLSITRGDKDNKDLVGTSWPRTEIKVGYRASLVESLPSIAKLLDHYLIENKELVGMLHEIEGGADVEEVSQKWVNEHNHDIIEWLTGFTIASESDVEAP